MKTTPLVLLSLGVLSSASPVPEGIHPVSEITAVDTHGLADRPNGDSSASSRRKGRALGARNRRTRRRQRQFRRDDDWTDDDNTTDDEQPAPVPAPALTPDKPKEEQHWTDDDGHYTSCDEFPDNEQCFRPPHSHTTQSPSPVATTRVNNLRPTTKPLGHGDDTDNPDWETDCDSDWTDDGEHERCKTKTKITPTTTAMKRNPSSTAVPVTTARSHDNDTDDPDYMTDCDTDWTDDGEHERCKTRTKTLGATGTKALTTFQTPDTTISAAASIPTEDTDTDNPDYLTDCDSDWTDDGERERCRTKVVSVTPTVSGSPIAPDNDPVEITNGATSHPQGVEHAVAMAGLVAAVAFVL
ncbi:hypothetical protein CDV36_001209 [Fusarium kuroshium]|uniref:Gram-positive cocci surface proteins LPxTG domain-containing protein n=1 Tax=Fusarium kuroshium TaxID=2010991 RepID=A0A3M2SNK9_9HYPO|nr:hypothetical protein CDV36_001209 [Fusarium kuroshium]